MSAFGRVRRRLRSLLWRADVDAEVAVELAFHLDMRAHDLAARGMDPGVARTLARARFGDVERIGADCRRIGHQREREMQRAEYLGNLAHDARFALRQLVRTPSFTVVAILTLALGIGATTSIFSVVEAVLLRPFAYANPGRTVILQEHSNFGDGGVSVGNFVDWQEATRSFEAIGAEQFRNVNLAEGDAPERVLCGAVTESFFRVFGVAPIAGRLFTAEEDQPGRAAVVLLSEGLWRRKFGGDETVLGRAIRLDGRAHEVVGVMPQSFDPSASEEQLWVPSAWTPERRAMHDEHFLNVVGLLKPGVTAVQAQREMEGIAKTVAARFPQQLAGISVRVSSLPEFVVGSFQRPLWLLLGAVSLVLLIACGNVANLLLARGAARAKEMAIRVAIGAGRGRIVRQLVTESLMLALLGAAAGLGIAAAGTRALVALAPAGVPRLADAHIDAGVLLFALAAAVASAVVFGLAPAFRASREDLQATLREEGRRGSGAGRDRMRSFLIAGEVALSLTLLTGAGLLIRSALNVQRVDLGFSPDRVLTARVALPSRGYREGADETALTFERVIQNLRARSGVAAAALSSQAPMGPGGGSNGLVPEGKPFTRESAVLARMRMVTPDYFATLGIRLVRGHFFTDADVRGGPRVMVISEALARAIWPGEDAVGKRVSCCEGSPEDPAWKTVIGVVRDVRSAGPARDVTPEFYMPIAQVPPAAWDWIQRAMTITVRSAGPDPAVLAGAIRAAVRTVDPSLPVYRMNTMRDDLRVTLAQARFNTLLLLALGVAGLLLAAVGIYGVISYFVSLRTHEIGLRMALGASASDVLRLMTLQAARPILAGVVLGTGFAAWGTRFLRDALTGVDARDPLTFGAVALLLVAVGFAATLAPALRATRVSPTQALQG